jgi:hypothetical protein
MNTATPIPEGYMENAIGNLVHISKVREQDKLRDQIANELVDEAKQINQRLRDFKQKALKDIADLIDIAATKYETKMGGKKGNISVMSYNGKYKVSRSYAERIIFTEEIEVAKELINDCIKRWSEGANDNIQALVDRAFRTNAQGQIKTAAVLDLLRIEIQDQGWEKAMEALKDSIQTTGTAVYVRVYERIGESDNYKPISLDLASV